MRFAEFVYYRRYCKYKPPMEGFDRDTWKRLCVSYQNCADVSKYFPDEPVKFRMVAITEMKLAMFVWDELSPYIHRGEPNKKHDIHELTQIVGKAIGRYVCEGELQAMFAGRGFPLNDYYPIKEAFFRKWGV